MPPGLIPNDLIQKVQEQNDIVEIISGYTQLKKSGRSYKALCPFHSEKTPSFYVHPDKQIFHCFGCGAGGNVFSFLMKFNKMNFGEAVRHLAEKKNIKIPKGSFVSRQTSDLARGVFKINEMASLHFEQSLKETREGLIALSYFEKRQIKRETIEKMRLGYAPLKWDSLSIAAGKMQISSTLLEKAGLILPRKDEAGYYDYFRKRIIFPIFDIGGKIIAFGGRVLDNSQPKYLNSPETPIFRKSEVLYGFNFAKDDIRKTGQALVVEGYLDFITLYQAGITNVVSSSGTSLTEGQVRLLKRFAKEVILIFDPDSAGKAATLRGIEVLLRHQFQVRIVSFKGGLDPDEFIRRKGKNSFLEAVKSASGFFDYTLEQLLETHNSRTIQGKIAIVEAILPWLRLVENSIARSGMFREISERVQVEEKDVIEEFNKLCQKKKPSEESPVPPPKYFLDAEGSLLKLMLAREENLSEIKKEIMPGDFTNDNLRKIAEIIWNYGDENRLPSGESLINYLPEEETRQALSFLMLNKTVFHDEAKAIKDCVNRIKKRRKIERQRALEREIKLAETKGEDGTIDKLLREYHNLVRAN